MLVTWLIMEGCQMNETYVTHAEIASYAEDKINLPSNLAKIYRDQVKNLRDKLEKHIRDNPDFGLVKMLNSGSVAKGTALKTINDMDVAVYLKRPVDTEEKILLDWLMSRLKEAYSNLMLEQFSCPQGAHCVTISFKSTGGTGLDVDVVPVIEDDNPDDDFGYLLAKDSGDRVLTNITYHLEFIQIRKDAQPHHFRQMVRLIKWWIKLQKAKDESFRFKSLMAELICAHLSDAGLDMSDYPNALLKFFVFIAQNEFKDVIYFDDYYCKDDLSKNIEGVVRIMDPVNPTNNVASKYSEIEKDKIVTAAKEAIDAISEARFATTKQRAIDRWKVIFGPTFTF